MKKRGLLENHYLPGDLGRNISDFVDHYNNQRYHENLGNVTLADAYSRRDIAILRERVKIKNQTIQSAASNVNSNQHDQIKIGPDPPRLK